MAPLGKEAVTRLAGPRVKRLGLVVVATLAAACSDSPTTTPAAPPPPAPTAPAPPPNRAPQAVGSISPQTVAVGQTAAVELAAHFTDPDGDTLTYGAASSDVEVATVQPMDGSVTITAVAQGNATLTVTATDPGGLAATLEFAVTVAPLAQTVFDALFDALMVEFTEEHEIGAAALGIMKDGEIVYDRAFGWMDRERTIPIRQDVMMRLASVTKPITAATIHELVRGGALDLDALVFDLGQPGGGLLDLTPFPSLGDARLAEITVRHLLQHRGGWDRDVAGDLTYREIEIAEAMSVPSPPGRENTVRYILGQPLQFDPGSESAYSNIGYLVLGLIIEEVSGQDYLSQVFRKVLAPLGIRSDDVIQGRTLPADRSDREPWYDHYHWVTTNVFDPGGPPVPWPDGGWDLESRIAQGGLVSTTGAVLRFLDVYQVFGDDIGTRRRRGAEPEGWRWTHTGSLDGTDTWAQHRWDGINYVILLNRRRPPPETSYVEELSNRITDLLDNTPIAWPQTGHALWTGGGAGGP